MGHPAVPGSPTGLPQLGLHVCEAVKTSACRLPPPEEPRLSEPALPTEINYREAGRRGQARVLSLPPPPCQAWEHDTQMPNPGPGHQDAGKQGDCRERPLGTRRKDNPTAGGLRERALRGESPGRPALGGAQRSLGSALRGSGNPSVGQLPDRWGHRGGNHTGRVPCRRSQANFRRDPRTTQTPAFSGERGCLSQSSTGRGQGAVRCPVG